MFFVDLFNGEPPGELRMFVLGHHGILSLLLLSFPLFLGIDLLHHAIPKRVKRPLLALVVDNVTHDFVELIARFSTMEENWRRFGGRYWSELVHEEDAVIMR